MKRILFMVFNNLFFVPFGWIKLCYYAKHVEKYTEEQRYSLLKYIVYKANKGGRIIIDTHGKENMPEKNGFMLYPNHQGLYDVLAIVDSVDKPLSAVLKKEIKDVPFIKQVMACMQGYALDRGDVRQSMRVIQQVSEDVKNGKNFIIFPEGTRSKKGNKLLEFKGGSFKAATKAKCPIVPVALIDSFKAFDTSSIDALTVQVHILKPLYYEEYKDMKTTEIAEEVKRRIEETIAVYEVK